LVYIRSDYNAKANASPPRTANPLLRTFPVAAAALLEVEAGPADVLELVVPVVFVVLVVEDEDVVPLEVVVDAEGVIMFTLVSVLVVPVLDIEGGSGVDEVSVATTSPPVM
jgi:hypothetical protein